MRSAWLALLLAAPLLGQPAPQRSPAPAPLPRLEVALAPRAATVGDHIAATLTLTVDPAMLDGEPRFPVWRGSWGDAEIEKLEEPKKAGGVYRQRLVLAAFRPGPVALPPVAVAVPLARGTVELRTPGGLALAIRSVLPPQAKDLKPRPPAPPRQLPLGARFWWTAALLAAACLAAGWALFRRRAGAPGEAARPALPPLAELLAALDALGSEPSVVAAHTRLSLAVRRYLGRALGFPAVESTTSEVYRRLLALAVPGPLVRRTVELLRGCDLVKFARQEVGESRSRERLAAAREIATAIEEHLQPAAAEPPALEAAG
jgi:hypothetical protein